MSPRTSPCGWTPCGPGGGACCPDINDPANLAAKAQAENIATSLIWRLTGMQYGACEVEVRPCKPRTCDPLTLSRIIYWDARTLAPGVGNLGVLSFFPTLIDGQVYNISCGCPTGCCKCRSDCEFILPGPVASVVRVTVGGVDMDPADWRVYDGNILAFNSDACPPCQDYNVDSGEIGSWSVTYNVGVPVPDELNLAAGIYAFEVFKLLSGDKSCGLPQRVQQVARQGYTATFVDPMVLAENGLTGIPLVDQIITAVNPYGLRQAPRVWAPGLYRSRRQSQ